MTIITCELCNHTYDTENSREPLKYRYVCPNCNELN